MKILKERIPFILFLGFLGMLWSLVPVYAETVSFNACLNTNCNAETCGAYNITYDTNLNPGITNEKALSDWFSIQNGINTGITLTNFTEQRYAYSCAVSDGKVVSCPSSKDRSNFKDFNQMYLLSDDNVNVTFNESNGTYTVQIADVYNNQLRFRYVVDGKERNDGGTKDNPKPLKTAASFPGEFLSRTTITTKDGKRVPGYVISNVRGSTTNVQKLVIETYLNNGDCEGAFINAFTIKIPTVNSIDIPNPAKADPNSYGCTSVFNYAPAGMSSSEVNGELLNLKKSYITECYTDTITYRQKGNLKNTISQKLDKLRSMFDGYVGNVSSGSIFCDNSQTNSKLVDSYQGSYWTMTMTEIYTAQGDTAKLVKSGDGFSYDSKFKITRIINIVPVGTPSMPEQCQTSHDHMCYWPGGSGSDGGPNEDFDYCVLECDNGKYTQSCINSCYKTVYGNNRNLTFSSNLSYDSSKKRNIFPIESCTTDHGNAGTVHGASDDKYCVSSYCEANGWCDEWESTYPDGCSDNPEADYASQVAAADQELQEIMNRINASVPVGKYTYKIADSYLETKNGKNYIFTVTSSTDPALGVNTSPVKTIKSASASVGYSESSFNSYYSYLENETEITVSLPLAYVNRVTGQAVYKTSLNSNKTFSIDFKNNRLDSINDFDANYYYYEEDGRKYYTSLWSENLNVLPVCDTNKINLYRMGDYNIIVESSEVGSGKFSSNIECYYGVYNSFYNANEDTDLCMNSSVEEPQPTSSPSDTTGIRYIFRPIRLDDMFPNNRNPRFNWTGTIDSANGTSSGAALLKEESFYGTPVDPETLIEEIQSKNESIYNVNVDTSEVDYDFVLTRENIRNIRKYNKEVRDYNGDGDKNYLDYNMNCYKNSRGQEVCSSKFLDNINGNLGSDSSDSFITYSTSGFGMDARKAIIGCNNAKAGQCDIISK